MHKHVLTLSALSLLVLTACNVPEEVKDIMDEDSSSSTSAMMEDDDSMMEDNDDTTTDDNAMTKDNDDMTTDGGVYTDFSADVIRNGETSVLFFHAAWCPYCRTHDELLTEWYNDNPYAVSVYKVDYDSSLPLRQKYGVTSQHTFVVIDGEGNKVTSITNYPSDSELQVLLEAAI